MSTENNSELKVMRVKSNLLADINKDTNYLMWQIENKSKDIQKIFEAKLQANSGDTISLDKTEYTKILTIINAIINKRLYDIPHESYLATYYQNIQTKTEILNQL